MTEYNAGQPEPAEILIDDQQETVTVDGVPFPYGFLGSMIQFGNKLGDDPFVRFHVPATTVRRIDVNGVEAEPMVRNEPPFADPDFEPDEEE